MIMASRRVRTTLICVSKFCIMRMMVLTVPAKGSLHSARQ